MNKVTVSMSKFVHWRAAALAVALLASGHAAATEKVDETKETVADPYVKIEHMNGEARIVVWDKKAVRVEGTLGNHTEEFKFRERDGEVKIKVETERNGRGWGKWSKDDGDDLTIYVPRASSIDYSAINANVSISDVSGTIDVEVVNGDVDIRDTTARLNLEAVNGDIVLKNVRGELAVETVNGDIRGDHKAARDVRLESVNGNIDVITDSPELSVETVNGNMELKLAKIVELDINTVNGRAEAQMTLDKKGDVRASSVGGSIELTFQQDVSARFDIEAHAGGRIVNNLSDEKMQKAKYGPRRWLQFSHNGGDARVEASTVSGRVTINGK